MYGDWKKARIVILSYNDSNQNEIYWEYVFLKCIFPWIDSHVQAVGMLRNTWIKYISIKTNQVGLIKLWTVWIWTIWDDNINYNKSIMCDVCYFINIKFES